MVATANLENAVNARKNDAQQKALQGRGFQGVQMTKESDRCEWVPALTEHGVTEPGHLNCYKVKTATTPGSVIGDSLSKSLNDVGVNFAASEVNSIIDSAITTIITAMIQRVMKEGTTLFH